MAIHASILAAGVGRRMGLMQHPKCLLEFDGVSLLDRHLAALAGAGVADISVVCGYKFWDIVGALETAQGRLNIKSIMNAYFRFGSVMSVSKLRQYWIGYDRYVLMDADVLYPPEFLSLLCSKENSADICILGDFGAKCDDEAVKIVEDSSGAVVDFGKEVEGVGARVGESVGFFSFSPRAAAFVMNRTREYINSDWRNEPYENVIRDAFRSGKFSSAVHDISGAPWTELDFPSDIEVAETEVMPRLRCMARDHPMPEVVSEHVR